jgi:hypothetical protein
LLPTTIYHFSTLGIVWSLFVDGPPTDEFLKNALYQIIVYTPSYVVAICFSSFFQAIFDQFGIKIINVVLNVKDAFHIVHVHV